jgi:hypothetical protein
MNLIIKSGKFAVEVYLLFILQDGSEVTHVRVIEAACMRHLSVASD